MGCCNSKLDRPQKKKSSGLPGTTSSTTKKKNVSKANFVSQKKGAVEDHYTIIKKLGSGGFGTVYQVVDKRTNIERAMKELPRSKMTQEASAQMLSEVEILRTLDHPNIMKVYELIESRKSYYIITEFLTGGDLFGKLLKEKNLSEKAAAKYVYDFMSAINYCHKNGIVHRDLKPENLLLENSDPDAKIKVIDFGISQKLQPHHKLNQAVGTIFYMAPETFTGSYDEKCDIWSAGVILYIMLCGSPPFFAENVEQMAEIITQGNLTFRQPVWNSVSGEAKSLIQSMLATDPEDRLNAEQVLNHAWFKSYINNELPKTALSTEALGNLGKFHAQGKLEKSIMTFISSQVTSAKEDKEFAELFSKMDKNKDGKLSQREILEGYKELGITTPPGISEVLKKIDSDGSGFLDYTEFVTASKDWKSAFEKNELESAFKMYDQGGDGKLSLKELKESIPDIEDSDWEKFLLEADRNGDSQIGLEELKVYLMQKIS
ncbi:unnamed protein product [Blepharisma stoltei]|uniref:non-specific serine/threonine protein kinase n=1 Tax=Blepharisma stoltei TaxID=1481888 RepID=A0AAU9J5E4_9CILI|nr:unnamed protein product [Blepharisma stoltei]